MEIEGAWRKSREAGTLRSGGKARKASFSLS